MTHIPYLLRREGGFRVCDVIPPANFVVPSTEKKSLRATQKKVDKHSNFVTIIYVETTWSKKLDGFDPHSQPILDLDTVSWPMNMQGKFPIYSQVFGTICLYMGVEKLLNVKLYWVRWIRAQVLGPPNLQHYVVGCVIATCLRFVQLKDVVIDCTSSHNQQNPKGALVVGWVPW